MADPGEFVYPFTLLRALALFFFFFTMLARQKKRMIMIAVWSVIYSDLTLVLLCMLMFLSDSLTIWARIQPLIVTKCFSLFFRGLQLYFEIVFSYAKVASDCLSVCFCFCLFFPPFQLITSSNSGDALLWFLFDITPTCRFRIQLATFVEGLLYLVVFQHWRRLLDSLTLVSSS